MKPERWQQLDRLFHSALQREPGERSALLDKECAGNAGLRREVEALLAAHAEAGSFIEKPAFDVEARSVAADQNELVVGQTIGHYQIVSPLGAGGMGFVYLAEDLRLDRKVALKILPATEASDQQWMRRFIQEAKAASALNHPNIITIHEIDQPDSIHFIANEFIDGETLRQRLARGRMPLREVLDIGIQAASALRAAHEAGIIHRDIKPENIMIRRDGLVKVLDFGLAKLIKHRQTVTVDTQAATKVLFKTEPGLVMGTAQYMSPEQTRGLEVDARTDIWSLGCVLYEMVTGQPPFAGATQADLLSAILNHEPGLLVHTSPEAPRELEHIVSKALRKDLEQRYQTVKDLLIDLQHLRHELELRAELERSVSPAIVGNAKARSTVATSRYVSSAKHIINQAKLHTRAAFVTLAVLALALMATLFWYFKHTPDAPILTDKDTILLADFENKTGDEVFDGTLKLGLASQLEQSPFLNVFPDSGVRRTLRLMNRSPNERVTTEVAREICERQGLKAFIAGSIALLGSRYVLTLETRNGRSGDVVVREQSEAAGKEQVLNALSAMVTKLREKLGESLSSIEQFGKQAQVTTSSVEALKAFSLGAEQVRKGLMRESIPFYKRAIELDPNFVFAYSILGVRYANLGQLALGAEYVAKAYALRDKVSETERLRIEDHYYVLVTHETDKRLEALEVRKRTYPRDQNAPNNLSDAYFRLGQFERAVDEAREAMRRDPNLLYAHTNLAIALIALNRFDDARQVCEAALQQFKDTDLHGFLYQIAFIAGDAVGIQTQLDWAKGNPEEYIPLDWQADTAAFAGNWQRAQDLSRRSIDLATRREAIGPASEYAAKAAGSGAVFGECTDAKRWAIQALKQDQSGQPPPAIALIGLVLCGERARAIQIAEDYNKRYPKDTFFNGPWLSPIRAAVELQRGDPARAIDLLEPAIRYEGASQFWSPYLRGQAYLKLNRSAEAATEFRKILDHRGRAPLSPLYPLAHLGLARAAALVNDTTTSRREYETFFALWKDADADLPILQQARREYAKVN